MEQNLLSILLCILLLFLVAKLLLRSRSSKKFPPSPPSLPFIGHLHHLKKPLHRTFLNLSQRYGPIMSLRLGSRPVVIVSSLSAAEECFTKNDTVLANRAKLLTGKHLAYNCTTIPTSSYGDHWRNLRRIGAIEIFSSHRLNIFSELRKDEINRLLWKLSRNAAGDFSTVEVRSLFVDLTFNVMMRMIAGKRYYGEDAPDVEEARQFREMIRELTKYASTSYPGDFLPILRWIDYQGYQKRLVRLGEKADKFLQGLVDESRTRKSSFGNTNSMIDHLLSLQESEPECYSDQMIKGLIQTLLLAGTDTSSVTLEWVLANVIKFPGVLKKARAEIDSQVGQDRLIDETDLPELHYLQCIIYETLRLYTPVPLLLPHLSSEDCTLGGYHVPAHTIVMVNAWAIHRDPKQWQEPTSFVPERFEGIGNDDRHKLILPFGMGRRACPGAPLAHRLIGLTMGVLIQCFDWDTEEELDMMENGGLTMPKAEPLRAMCKARHVMRKIVNESSTTS
ncbi:isoflavone 2'-hydroxylase-like [Punica granatum]|uniref:Isoflavone 2'-hydroxylase-like n=3 Tax=Punica granatum TaxID=22663 RepID=A0A218W065_PUNGR|nr:isoflavone 2'-hydroxylase-like [Punica granatum]OWM65661.1 hypothetical protein CDL15_Pgr017158 [Punica granatum]